MLEKNIKLNEETTFSSKVEIGQKLAESLNFAGTTPLNAELRYVMVPQKNTAATYVIDGAEVVSPRLFLAGIDDDNNIVEVRTVGVNTLRAMAYGFVTVGEPAPVIEVTVNNEGKFRAKQGTPYVHAMESTSFLKAEDNRVIVAKPVTIVSLGARQAYTSSWENHEMVTEDGHAVLTTVNMKVFKRTDNPTESLIEEAVKAIKEVAGNNFYGL